VDEKAKSDNASDNFWEDAVPGLLSPPFWAAIIPDNAEAMEMF
jgi:hypothetical protein